LGRPDVQQWRDAENTACTRDRAKRHHHVIGHMPRLGLPILWHHLQQTAVAAPLRCTYVRNWNLRALCQWAVSACAPQHYLRVVHFVLCLDAAVPDCWEESGRLAVLAERWSRQNLLAWFLRRAPAQLVHSLSKPLASRVPPADQADFLDCAHKILAAAGDVCEHLYAEDDFHDAKHLALLRWLHAAKPLSPLPPVWRLQLILTDPALDEAARRERIAAENLFAEAPSSKNSKLRQLVPLPLLLQCAQASPHYAEYLIAGCTAAEAPADKLAALTKVARVCAALPERRAALLEWIKKKKWSARLGKPLIGELAQLRGTADSAQLLEAIAFLAGLA